MKYITFSQSLAITQPRQLLSNKKLTFAQYFLKSPAKVAIFLEMLLEQAQSHSDDSGVKNGFLW
jgi:hypothetical protein